MLKWPFHIRRSAGAHATGLQAERLSVIYLRLKGYRILARRYKVKSGEIDLIARRGRTIVFVEVKAHATLDGSLYALKPFQQRRIQNAAQIFLQGYLPFKQISSYNIRFDGMFWGRGILPLHLKNIWQSI